MVKTTFSFRSRGGQISTLMHVARFVNLNEADELRVDFNFAWSKTFTARGRTD